MFGSGDYLDEFEDNDYLQQDYFEHSELPSDVWDHCVLLSVNSIIPTVTKLVALNFVFSILYSADFLSLKWAHICTGSMGIYLVTTLESGLGKFLIFSCFIISFFMLRISYLLRRRFNCQKLVTIPFIALLIMCEYFMVDPETWLEIRGIIMILAMKLISLAGDIDSNGAMPSFTEYYGYIFCAANVLFGPWISYSEYITFYRRPSRKGVLWFLVLFQVVCAAFIFLTISNCWANYFISDFNNRWFLAFREALSFRTSHYFISFLSEAGMVSCGFYSQIGNRRGLTIHHRFVVTEPFEIEFPTSLSNVVRKWNHPMHEFLKKYIYRSCIVYGKFWAILATFLMSSFLHGFELKVSLVLISIGVFSYLQIAARSRFAEIFDVCVKVRPCRDCTHKYKRNTNLVRFLLLLYTLGTVFHLTYLGVLMDSSTYAIGIYYKWQHLYFASHIMMVINLLFIL